MAKNQVSKEQGNGIIKVVARDLAGKRKEINRRLAEASREVKAGRYGSARAWLGGAVTCLTESVDCLTALDARLKAAFDGGHKVGEKEPSAKSAKQPVGAAGFEAVMRAARAAYDDGILSLPATVEVAKAHKSGDALADFIVTELAETAAGEYDAVHEACTALDRATEQLQRVRDAIAALPHDGG